MTDVADFAHVQNLDLGASSDEETESVIGEVAAAFKDHVDKIGTGLDESSDAVTVDGGCGEVNVFQPTELGQVKELGEVFRLPKLVAVTKPEGAEILEPGQ